LQARQHGLFTTEQWLALEFTRPALKRRTDRGEVERVLPRVYRSVHAAQTLPQRALAAVLWAGDDAFASHLTALAIWDVIESAPLHLWVPPSHSSRVQGLTVHRGVIAANDRRLRYGVPVTSPARTLVDSAAVLDEEDLEATLEELLRRGLTTPMAVQRCAEALGGTGRKGSQRLRPLLAARGDHALEYRLEVKLWRLLRKARLKPVRQHEVNLGGSTYRLDFAFPDFKVAIEGDGYASHGGRRAFEEDRRRLAALVADGWSVIPVTWDQCINRPSAVVAAVSGALLHAA